ncbi:MAG: hypothetical protein HY897_16460 [Deltaproteobacteria bacterium]|nr:hypothetical protein [Deltaproteobacteria bacterium]
MNPARVPSIATSMSLFLAVTCGCGERAVLTGDGGVPAAGETLDAGTREDTGTSCSPMKVVLPEHPSPASDMAEDGQDYLDRLATGYVCGLPAGESADDAHFMYGYAPIAAFNEIIAGRLAEIRKMRWMLFVSGHFGGVWLHGGLGTPSQDGGAADAGADGGGIPDMDGGLLNADGIARAAEAAAAGTDEELFAYNLKSLTEFLLPNLGIASNFGYNKGYLLEIVERPPAGCVPPVGFVSCEGLLWCTYAAQRIPTLAALRTVAGKLNTGDGRWRGLRDGVAGGPGVREAQEATEPLGHQVWEGILSREGMEQEFYLSLLDVSASFLESVQATGLFAAKGYAEKDVQAGRTSAMMQSALAFWLASYMGAFMGGSDATSAELPRIVPTE